MNYSKNAYLCGVRAALTKLAGTVSYAPRSSNESQNFSENRFQNLWKEMDDNAFTTGEESAVGMPSAPGIDKTANGDMLAYFRDNPDKLKEKLERDRKKKAADDYANSSDTVHSVGGMDANQHSPSRELIQRDAISQAFDINRTQGEELGLGDPPITNPHGSKTAANPLAGGSSPISMSLPSLPNVGSGSLNASGFKPPGIPKMKPPGQNVMSDIRQNSDLMLSSNSIMSRGTRAIGSSLPAGASSTGASVV